MTHDLLRAHALGRRIGERWLWRGLDLTLSGGEAAAVRGPSGAGKTLLLRTLAGLEHEGEGEVAFEGRPLHAWAMPSYRARVRYLPQIPALGAGTVEQNLRLPHGFRTHRGVAFDLHRAIDLLAKLGRDDAFLSLAAPSLSGGEGQLVAIVRALLLPPRVLLLDEPTASLDDAATRAVESLVTKWLHEAPDRALLWSSHHEEQLARVSGRLIDLGAPA